MTAPQSSKPKESHQDPLGYETFRPQLERVKQTLNSIHRSVSSLSPSYYSPGLIGRELNQLVALREKTDEQLAAWIVSEATEITSAVKNGDDTNLAEEMFDAISLILALEIMLHIVTAFNEEARNAKR